MIARRPPITPEFEGHTPPTFSEAQMEWLDLAGRKAQQEIRADRLFRAIENIYPLRDEEVVWQAILAFEKLANTADKKAAEIRAQIDDLERRKGKRRC